MPQKKLRDIQSLPDDRNIPIDRAGVKGLAWPITVLDKKHGKQTTVATVNLYVNLPHNFRGTHMSRFVEVLNDYRGSEWLDSTGEILKKLRKSLDADEAYMEIEFPYFIEKKAPVTKIPSLMSYTCRVTASYQKGQGEDFVLGVAVPVGMLCPCSKEISSYGAHNQRCTVTVQIRYTAFIWIEELIDIVETSASADLYSVLKRPDEKYITEHAYTHPMFVEDVVREIARKLNDNDHITWYAIEADSQESIHNHNAYARVEKRK